MERRKKYVPFPDPQAEAPDHMCPLCGREVYASDGWCVYCQAYNTP